MILPVQAPVPAAVGLVYLVAVAVRVRQPGEGEGLNFPVLTPAKSSTLSPRQALEQKSAHVPVIIQNIIHMLSGQIPVPVMNFPSWISEQTLVLYIVGNRVMDPD
jgi:hypothetical protein